MTQSSLSIIVLTKNEENNLPALLDSVSGLKASLFVVDSGSTDRTVDIAKAGGCTVVTHPFENYAKQRNWAFDHLPLRTPWVLCLDADERLTPELRTEIQNVVGADDPDVNGYILRKRTIFMGRWLRHGGQYPAWHLRLFRTGRGRCEDRLYDQHFIVEGRVERLKNDYIDTLTDDITTWTARHNIWATLEAAELRETASRQHQLQPRLQGTPLERKRFLRLQLYAKAPRFLRPFLLFIFDYVIRLGFLDGIPGLIFHVLQRFWFRFLVDVKMYEYEQKLKP